MAGLRISRGPGEPVGYEAVSSEGSSDSGCDGAPARLILIPDHEMLDRRSSEPLGFPCPDPRCQGWGWAGETSGRGTVRAGRARTVVTGQLRKQRVAEEDLEEAMREHGIESLDQVQLAVLETDGTISIVPVTSPTLRSHRGRARALRKK